MQALPVLGRELLPVIKAPELQLVVQELYSIMFSKQAFFAALEKKISIDRAFIEFAKGSVFPLVEVMPFVFISADLFQKSLIVLCFVEPVQLRIHLLLPCVFLSVSGILTLLMPVNNAHHDHGKYQDHAQDPHDPGGDPFDLPARCLRACLSDLIQISPHLFQLSHIFPFRFRFIGRAAVRTPGLAGRNYGSALPADDLFVFHECLP